MFKFQFLIMCALVFGPNYANDKSAHLHEVNYTEANSKCQDHGGLLDVNLFRSSSLFSGIIENDHELESYRLLQENVTVWVSGRATSGPYIALYTCMSLDKHTFAEFENVTFPNNILYECSVNCAQKLHNIGYMGITGNTCICIFESYTRFPQNPECEEKDFLDTTKGIIVFKLQQSILTTQTYLLDFNCISASIEKGSPQYYNIKCLSTLYGICSNRIDSILSTECIPKYSESFCLLKENTTFLEHTKTCLKYGGALLSVTSGVTEFLNPPVMLGSFRAFKAIEDDGKNNQCLTITKLNGTIYLETERCSNKNDVICKDDTLDKSGCVSKDGVKTYLLIILVLYLLW